MIDARNDILTIVPNENEVHDTISDMSLSSAPGPDGFGGAFFKAHCKIIKYDLVTSVQFFFSHGYIHGNFNFVHVILIPKVKNANMVEQFRPIVLANFQFKIITRILSDRLVPISLFIVSPQQSAFIRGRHISDCIITTLERVNVLDTKTYAIT